MKIKMKMKRPNKEMAEKIESMLNDFSKINAIARKIKTQIVTVYRYASHLGYTKVMISSEELEMIIRYRNARKAVKAAEIAAIEALNASIDAAPSDEPVLASTAIL
jgi:hypothetical protein